MFRHLGTADVSVKRNFGNCLKSYIIFKSVGTLRRQSLVHPSINTHWGGNRAVAMFTFQDKSLYVQQCSYDIVCPRAAIITRTHCDLPNAKLFQSETCCEILPCARLQAMLRLQRQLQPARQNPFTPLRKSHFRNGLTHELAEKRRSYDSKWQCVWGR